jgi:hypothetical protein
MVDRLHSEWCAWSIKRICHMLRCLRTTDIISSSSAVHWDASWADREATLLVAVEEEEEEDEEEAETEAAAGAGMASDVEYISVVVSSCHIMLTDALGSPVMAPHWSIHVGWLRS